MNSDQNKVATGAFTGVICMIVLVAALYTTLPPILGLQSPLDRLIFTLQMNALALIPLFIALVTVGNERFLSKAIDPLRHAEDKTMQIDARVADNTLQQSFLFFVGTMALSTFLNAGSIKLILVLTLVYIAARIIFWIGYRMDPMYRAPGMAATAYLNLGILLATLYNIVF